MADWFVARQGQQQGPFNEATLRTMVTQNAVSADDVVWRDGMPEWLPAGRVPELTGLFTDATASAAPATTPATVPYSQKFTEGGVTILSDRGFDMLRQTKPWVRLVGVLIIVVACLMFVGAGIGLLFAVIAGANGSGVGGGAIALMSVLYAAFALLYFMPGLYLYRYASRIGELMAGRREDQLDMALEAQKSFWKFIGIVILITIGLWLGMVGLAIAGASFGGSGHSFTVPTPTAPQQFPARP